MTVDELIEQLQRYPGHREVVIKDPDVEDWFVIQAVEEKQDVRYSVLGSNPTPQVVIR